MFFAIITPKPLTTKDTLAIAARELVKATEMRLEVCKTQILSF